MRSEIDNINTKLTLTISNLNKLNSEFVPFMEKTNTELFQIFSIFKLQRELITTFSKF